MPKLLSKKELVAIAEIIQGSLCVYNFFLIDLYDEKFMDLTLFKHRCISISLSFFSFFNAVGTWFWYSNIKTTKMLIRIQKVLTYLVLSFLLLFTHFSYKSNYGPAVWGYFDQNIFYDELDRIHRSFLLVCVIFVLSIVVIGVNIYFIRFRIMHLLKKKKQRHPNP